MTLSSLRPLLRTHQLDETIAFYTQLIGFTLAEKNEEWGWASLYKDNVAIMVATPNAHFPFDQPLFTGSFYFTTDDVDTL
ncbi:MAG TPA: VOC family protein [Chitinophagaceae bacterium]|nr:VOC family protein [Chitinophagaceae bacterium]